MNNLEIKVLIAIDIVKLKGLCPRALGDSCMNCPVSEFLFRGATVKQLRCTHHYAYDIARDYCIKNLSQEDLLEVLL